ncbi:MAG: glycosyltransferase [Bryobacteraceae bacterium]
MTPTKVLYFAPSLAWMGGCERQLIELATRLDRSQFLPFVWNGGADGPPAQALREQGVVVLTMPLNPVPGEIAIAARRLEAFRPDIFHSIAFHQHCAELEAAKAARIPAIVVSLGDLRFWDPWSRERSWETRRRELADVLVANCHAVARQYTDPAAIRLIYNGVASHAIVPKPISNEIVFVNVANLRPVKAHGVLVRAFALVASQVSDVRLIIVGKDGGALPALRALSSELGVSDKVTFTGGRLDVTSLLAAAEIYVHSSRSEGLPNAVLEAMAAGLPVVATGVGGVGEAVIRDVTGKLVPPDRPDLLAAAMTELAAAPALRATFGAVGRQTVTMRFAVEQMVAEHERLYQSCRRA